MNINMILITKINVDVESVEERERKEYTNDR